MVLIDMTLRSQRNSISTKYLSWTDTNVQFPELGDEK